MIPVLMAIIALLDLTAPEPNRLPTGAPFARWLIVDQPIVVSLAFSDPTEFSDWAADRALTTDSRDLDGLIWVRVRGDAEWLDQSWPGQPTAAAAMGDFPLWDWED